jgi:hypothetical protein
VAVGQAADAHPFAQGTERAMADKPTMLIDSPLVIMYEDRDAGIVCRIHKSAKVSSHEHYGILVCDLVRHVARAFKVAEDDVWKWVDKERRKPTSDITTYS